MKKLVENNSDSGSGCSSGRIPCRMREAAEEAAALPEEAKAAVLPI